VKPRTPPGKGNSGKPGIHLGERRADSSPYRARVSQRAAGAQATDGGEKRVDIGRLFGDTWELIRSGRERFLVGAFVLAAAWLVPFLGLIPLGVALRAAMTRDAVPGTSLDDFFGAFTIGTLVVVVLGVLAVALIYPALQAGLYWSVLQRVRARRPMEYGDVVKGFRFWGDAFVALLLEGLAYVGIILGTVLTAVLLGLALGVEVGIAAGVLLVGAGALACAYLGIRWIYLLPVIVDRAAAALESFAQSGILVRRTGWWITFAAALLMYLVVWTASGIGSSGGVSEPSVALIVFSVIVSLVVSTATTAFQTAYVSAMYVQASGETQLFDANLRGTTPPRTAPEQTGIPSGGWQPQPPGGWQQPASAPPSWQQPTSAMSGWPMHAAAPRPPAPLGSRAWQPATWPGQQPPVESGPPRGPAAAHAVQQTPVLRPTSPQAPAASGAPMGPPPGTLMPLDGQPSRPSPASAEFDDPSSSGEARV